MLLEIMHGYDNPYRSKANPPWNEWENEVGVKARCVSIGSLFLSLLIFRKHDRKVSQTPGY
jgi:hypothetical protein